ncbi:MAG: effector-associated constant component EACC1 [Actinomycetota bacterium]
MPEERIDLVVEVGGEVETDVEELAGFAYQLRRELLQLDIETVSLARSGPTPPGAKGIEAAAMGILLVKLVSSSGLLTAVADVVRSWLSRNPGRSVKLEIDGDRIEVAGISSAEQRRLIGAWIAHHATSE